MLEPDPDVKKIIEMLSNPVSVNLWYPNMFLIIFNSHEYILEYNLELSG